MSAKPTLIYTRDWGFKPSEINIYKIGRKWAYIKIITDYPNNEHLRLPILTDQFKYIFILKVKVAASARQFKNMRLYWYNKDNKYIEGYLNNKIKKICK